MAWLILLLAAACEVVWAITLKKSDGFTHMGYGVTAVVFMIISFVLLAVAMKSLPAGTAYAVWTGLGALGAALIGMMILGEDRGLGRIISLALVLAGVVGLKYFSTEEPKAATDASAREKG
ncbi:MAG: multidrug efflux SMR transporter [Planctomycetes bacterium]|nr:multidrug efflux SMR transporter [Planctomycetota bacterium]